MIWIPFAVLAVALVVWVSYWFELRRIERHRDLEAVADGILRGQPSLFDEKVLLGPVSAWIDEGERRAVREWDAAISPEEFRAAPQWRPGGLIHTPPAPMGADWTYKGWLKGCPCLDCEWIDVTPLNGGGTQWTRGRQCAKHATAAYHQYAMRVAEYR